MTRNTLNSEELVPDTLDSDIPFTDEQERQVAMVEIHRLHALHEWLEDPDRCRECPLITVK